MSTGIDKEIVRGYYKSMTDQQIISALHQKLSGLTAEALEIINEEIQRRNLHPNIGEAVAAQQHTDNAPEIYYDKDSCPVTGPERIWLEHSFQTLLNIFGEEPTRNRKVLTPERAHFPVRYDGSERSAIETLGIIAAQMEVAPDCIQLDFFDETLSHITEGNPGGMYWGKGDSGHFEISLLRSQLNEPENMVAILAHEVAHIKLLGENRMQENNEPITDLTTLFFGLGIFNANSAFQTFADAKSYGWSSAGYLSQLQWGYALALFAWFRNEQDPPWAKHLCQNVQSDFMHGQHFIVNNEDLIFRSRG